MKTSLREVFFFIIANQAFILELITTLILRLILWVIKGFGGCPCQVQERR